MYGQLSLPHAAALHTAQQNRAARSVSDRQRDIQERVFVRVMRPDKAEPEKFAIPRLGRP